MSYLIRKTYTRNGKEYTVYITMIEDEFFGRWHYEKHAIEEMENYNSDVEVYYNSYGS